MVVGETEGQLSLWCPWGSQVARARREGCGLERLWRWGGDVRAGCCGRQGLESPGMLATVIQVQSKLEGKKEQGEEERGEEAGAGPAHQRSQRWGEGVPGKITPPTRDVRQVLSMLAPS